jgi:hypothetical protein
MGALHRLLIIRESDFAAGKIELDEDARLAEWSPPFPLLNKNRVKNQ